MNVDAPSGVYLRLALQLFHQCLNLCLVEKILGAYLLEMVVVLYEIDDVLLL